MKTVAVPAARVAVLTWGGVLATKQGLQMLDRRAGRRAEWSRLLEGIVPDFVDPITEGPLLGKRRIAIL